MHQNELEYLLDKYESKQLSEEEWALLLTTVAENPHIETLIQNRLSQQMDSSTVPVSENKMDEALSLVLSVDKPALKPVKRIRNYRLYWAAASVAVLLIAGTVFYLNRSPELVVSSTEASAPADVLPGSDKAILTLSDGRRVELDVNNAASATINDGDVIIANNNGGLSYKNAGVAAINTMSTPKGGQYHLELADGSKVWLNAASSITYPTAFTGKTREVTVTGEAYFEIAKNKSKPFIVKTALKNITVLGTSFNINCYPDENWKTSLLEGAVSIGGKILQPGQAYVNDKVQATDIQKDIAWKNGLFNFEGADFQTVMRQLARWYDIDVEYEGEVPSRYFEGKMDRGLTLTQALKILKETGIGFRIEGRKLIISK